MATLQVSLDPLIWRRIALFCDGRTLLSGQSVHSHCYDAFQAELYKSPKVRDSAALKLLYLSICEDPGLSLYVRHLFMQSECSQVVCSHQLYDDLLYDIWDEGTVTIAQRLLHAVASRLQTLLIGKTQGSSSIAFTFHCYV